MTATVILDIALFIGLLRHALSSGDYGGFIAYVLLGTWGVLTIGYWVAIIVSAPFAIIGSTRRVAASELVQLRPPGTQFASGYLWPTSTAPGWLPNQQQKLEFFWDGSQMTGESRPITVGWHMFPHDKQEWYWSGRDWTDRRPISDGWHRPYRDECEWLWNGGGWVDKRKFDPSIDTSRERPS